MELQENIKKLRKKRGWSQAELAEKVGTHLTHINRLEKGKYNPSLDILLKLADAFEVSLDVLVHDDNDNLNEIKIEDKSLAQRIQLIDSLESEDKKALIRVIDSMLTKQKILRVITNKEEVAEGVG